MSLLSKFSSRTLPLSRPVVGRTLCVSAQQAARSCASRATLFSAARSRPHSVGFREWVETGVWQKTIESCLGESTREYVVENDRIRPNRGISANSRDSRVPSRGENETHIAASRKKRGRPESETAPRTPFFSRHVPQTLSRNARKLIPERTRRGLFSSAFFPRVSSVGGTVCSRALQAREGFKRRQKSAAASSGTSLRAIAGRGRGRAASDRFVVSGSISHPPRQMLSDLPRARRRPLACVFVDSQYLVVSRESFQ